MIIERRGNYILYIEKETGYWGIFPSNGEFPLNIEEDAKRKILKIFREDFSNTLCLFIFHFAEGCNLKCKYCFANASVSGEGKVADSFILYEGIKKIARTSSPGIRVEFSAGEPLLHYKLIFKIIEEAISIFTNSNKNFDFHIQTNGTVLNNEIVNFLKKYSEPRVISIGISADGPPEIHNRNRVFPNNRGSFEIVIKNMKRLCEAGIKFGILSVVERPDEVEKIYNFWVNEGYSHIRLNPIFRAGRSKRIFSENEQKEFAYAELEIFRKSLKDGVFLQNVYYLLQNIILYERPYMCLRSPCGAGISQICINWDGDIYSCQEFISSSNFVIGNILKCEDIEQLLLVSPIIKNLRNRTVENINECKECVWKKFCGNSCAAKTYFFYGDYMRKNPFCTYYKTIFKELIWEIFFQKDKILEVYFKKYLKKGV